MRILTLHKRLRDSSTIQNRRELNITYATLQKLTQQSLTPLHIYTKFPSTRFNGISLAHWMDIIYADCLISALQFTKVSKLQPARLTNVNSPFSNVKDHQMQQSCKVHQTKNTVHCCIAPWGYTQVVVSHHEDTPSCCIAP